MEHLLFAAYLVLFAWLVTKVKFFRDSGLTQAQLVICFLLKVLAGIFYGWIGVYYGEMAQMVDTWAYHYQSLTEYQLLLDHPKTFVSSLFSSSYESGHAGFFATKNSWWNDLKGTSFLKLLAVFNLFSLGNYYVNVILYAFITLFGPIAVFRVMNDVFPGNKLAVLGATFLVPSFLYWTSGLHKDGIIFLGMALMVYQLYNLIKGREQIALRLGVMLFSLLLILALRNFLVLLIIPAFVTWFAASKLKLAPLKVFSLAYLFFLLLFFGARYLHPSLDFPRAVSERQDAFLGLSGNSAVTVTPLEPTISGFARNAPQAFSLSTLRPFPSDVRHLLSLAAAIEINFLLLLFGILLIWRRDLAKLDPFITFCIFLSFSIFLMVGYTVNFLGAIVRYRSIVLPFLVIPMVALIDWKRAKDKLLKIIY